MGNPINVPYIAIIGYVIFVIGSSLLVGLLPPFVNRPKCDPDKEKSLFEIIQPQETVVLSEKTAKLLESVHKRLENKKQEKERELNDPIDFLLNNAKTQKKTSKKSAKNIVERFRSANLEHPARNAFFKQKIGKIPEEKAICPEIDNPVLGISYPWYDDRLPDYVLPTLYDIELYVPEWIAPIYDGFIEITIKLTKQTNYILLHSKVQTLLLNQLLDSKGNALNITCLGEIEDKDYLVIKTDRMIQPIEGPLKLSFYVVEFLTNEIESGIFEISFDNAGKKSKLLASRFEPISAREAYPVFDEPHIKAQYIIKIDHPNNTLAFSNAIRLNEEPIPGINGEVQTLFAPTPPMSPYLMAFVVCDTADFDYDTYLANNNIPIRIWARRRYVDEEYALSTLELTVKIYNQLEDIFRNVDRSSLPAKIDIFAIPDYPVDAIGHFGLPIFKENKILFDKNTASERDIQTIGLLIAEHLSNFWFGNYVSIKWWDELWLETALADYIKYRAVDQAYPAWNILDQFITEELIYALVDDGYPSTHPIYKPINNPYEIEGYYDEVEKAAAAAILRMVEEEKNIAEMYDALTAYLNAHPWGVGDINVFYNTIGKIGPWSARDFFDRWTKQANYPLLKIQLIEDIDNQQAIQVTQSRALNSEYSIFAGDLLYPSPFGDFLWYVPLQCSFGTGPYNGNSTYETTFYIDTKNYTRVIPTSSDGLEWIWVHCDRKFTGYYETDYTNENWEYLGTALKLKNNEFDAEDRANIIHNLFLNAFTERTTYFQLVDVLSYLRVERDYLPWRTVYKHVIDMAEILEYKKSFIEFSAFFTALMRDIEVSLDPWNPAGNHIEELLKETILNLACRMQDSYCLKKAAEVWTVAFGLSQNGNFSNIALPAYIRELVFNYHIQTTYDLQDWRFILRDYETTDDLVLQRKLLEALTFSRLPSLLNKFVEANEGQGLRNVDFFDGMRLLSENQLGREKTWDYLRSNFFQLLDTYSLYDPRIGQLIVDITKSFETEFLFFQLLFFIIETTDYQGVSGNARFKAVELVSTNVIWLQDKEEEIIQAFGDPRREKYNILQIANQKESSETRKIEFIHKVKSELEKYFGDKKEIILKSKKI